MALFWEFYNEQIPVELAVNRYINSGSIALSLYVASDYNGDDMMPGEPWSDLTVYVCPLPDNLVALDTNNNDPESMRKFIEDNDIGTYTGESVGSGFCDYPVVELNFDKLWELDPTGMEGASI